MAVALEVEALLDSGQLGRLDRFVPRLTVSEAARDALDLLEQRLDAACAERRSVGELAAATTQAVARGVARLLAACRAPASVVELAGRQVAASLGLERLTGRPSSDLQPALEQIVAWGRACRGSLDGPRLRPDRMLALTASLLDSPLLPAAVYPVRLQRRSLELVMICPVFSRYLS
jgi:hypothetical protein